MSRWHSSSLCSTWPYARSWQDRRSGVYHPPPRFCSPSFPPFFPYSPLIYIVKLYPSYFIYLRLPVQTHKRNSGNTLASTTLKFNLKEMQLIQVRDSHLQAAVSCHKSFLIATFFFLLLVRQSELQFLVNKILLL